MDICRGNGSNGTNSEVLKAGVVVAIPRQAQHQFIVGYSKRLIRQDARHRAVQDRVGSVTNKTHLVVICHEIRLENAKC